MIIARAYEMLIAGHRGKDARGAAVPAAGPTGQDAWLSAGIYRAVSLAADIIERLGRRRPARG